MQCLNGQELIRLISADHTWLKGKSKIVDNLNVFPVPDGDTGTNMVLTLESAVEEISKVTRQDIIGAGQVAEITARGALLGARGNSGVILSQFLDGFSQGLNSKESIDFSDLSKAFNKGTALAYQSVSQPVEGTILTVMQDAADAASQAVLDLFFCQSLLITLKNQTHSFFLLFFCCVLAALSRFG